MRNDPELAALISKAASPRQRLDSTPLVTEIALRTARIRIAPNPRPSARRGTVPPAAQPVLDQLAVYGTGDQVSEQLKPWDQAADIVTILLPPGLPWPTVEATLRAAAAQS